MSAYAQVRDSGYYKRRSLVGVISVGLPILMLWGLASGMVQKGLDLIAPPIEADIAEEVKKEDEPPPPPPPEFERPPVELPPPEVSIDIPIDAPATTAITDVTDKPVPVAPPPPPREPVRVAARLDAKRSPSTDDYYPESSRRNGEEGVVQIRACTTTDGRSSGDATVAKSSGFTKLDEAAVRWAKRARFSPATEDGRPIEACTNFNVRFKITD
jgi:periplasmic protein TonB